MDFIDKKEKLIELLEKYVQDKESKGELLSYINELSNDSDFRDKDLFRNLFSELNNYLDELSSKEIKQRISIIRTFID